MRLEEPCEARPQMMSEPAVTAGFSWTVLSDLVKARLTLLVLLTTLFGFFLGSKAVVNYGLLVHTMLGTGLLAAGAAALNQYIEREHDAKMRRTEDRPLPSKKLAPRTALLLGAVISVVGMVHLAIAVDLLTSLIGASTLISYLFVYTPLKRVTTLNTIIGAVPGALPPLMGWTAASGRGEIASEGMALFGILFFWQLPHFLAIAWLYREDYAKAGFQLLPVVDLTGERTGRTALAHTLGLLPISLLPVALKMAGVIYFCGAMICGLTFAYAALRFSRELSRERARALFFASLLYLPVVLGLMVFDRIKN